MKVYYRRIGTPYAFPATRTSDVDVSILAKDTGPGDSDWRVTEIEVEGDRSADFFELGANYTEPGLIADSLVVELAIRERLGLGLPKPSDWTAFTPSDLDHTSDIAHENLCDAVEQLYGYDAAQIQRVSLRSRLSDDYIRSHDVLES